MVHTFHRTPCSHALCSSPIQRTRNQINGFGVRFFDSLRPSTPLHLADLPSTPEHHESVQTRRIVHRHSGSSRTVATPCCSMLSRRPPSRPPSPLPRPTLSSRPSVPSGRDHTSPEPPTACPCSCPCARRHGRAPLPARQPRAPIARPSPSSNYPCSPQPLGHGGTAPRPPSPSAPLLHPAHHGPGFGFISTRALPTPFTSTPLPLHSPPLPRAPPGGPRRATVPLLLAAVLHTPRRPRPKVEDDHGRAVFLSPSLLP